MKLKRTLGIVTRFLAIAFIFPSMAFAFPCDASNSQCMDEMSGYLTKHPDVQCDELSCGNSGARLLCLNDDGKFSATEVMCVDTGGGQCNCFPNPHYINRSVEVGAADPMLNP